MAFPGARNGNLTYWQSFCSASVYYAAETWKLHDLQGHQPGWSRRNSPRLQALQLVSRGAYEAEKVQADRRPPLVSWIV